MHPMLEDFLHGKAKMTDSSECGSIIECLQTGLESRDQDCEQEGAHKYTYSEDLDHLDCMLDEFKGWAESLKEDIAELRKKHKRKKPVKS